MKGLLFVVQIASIAIYSVSSHLIKTENEGKRLIKTSEQEPGKWMTEEDIFQLIQENQGFIDITDFNYPDIKTKTSHADAIPTTLRFNETVQELITQLDSTRVEIFLLQFSSYFNRYHSSPSGRESQQWLLSQVEDIVENYAGEKYVVEVDHDGYLQRSIVVQLLGADETLKNEVVIIGAHLDSVTTGPAARAPGADDNGSGTVAILEALRAIVETGVIFKRTVEFHWYAAEEVGLRGSQAIAESYREQNVNVVGMLNLDVVGYHVPGVDEIAIYTDYASSELAQFARILTDGYLSFGRRNRTCGYGCSDHASFSRNGYAAVFVAEAIDSPYMHRLGDTVATVDINQVNEFIKLSIGFAVEMGEPTVVEPPTQ